MRFLDELRRRKVARVAVVYAATGFVVLQAADLLAEGLRLPDIVFTIITLLVILGFPVALVFGWALELTPEGIRRTAPDEAVDGATPAPSLLGRGTVAVAAALVLLGTGLGAGWFLRPSAATGDPAAKAADAKSLAVLPFTDLSEGGDQRWFADGLAEEVLTSLANLPELRVIGRSSSFLFTAGETNDRVIADTLGVAHLVKGSVRRVGDQIRVSAQLVRAADGVQLWSESYDAGADSLLAVQRDIAEKIAAALDVVLDDERRESMFASGTRSVEAFEAYLRGRELFMAAHTGSEVTLADANEWLGRAVELDTGFARAVFLHADRFGHLVVDGPMDTRLGPHQLTIEQGIQEFRRDFERAARARDPRVRILAEINRVFFSSDWRRLPALMDELRTHAAPDQPAVDDPWGRHVPLVLGRIEMAREIAAGMVRSDPLNPIAWSQRVQVELAGGDTDAARAVIAESGSVLGQSGWARGFLMIIAMLEGDRDSVLALLEESSNTSALAAAIHGDSETAIERARAFEERWQWPDTRLLNVYHQLGDRERNRELVRRIDAMPAGPAMLARELSLTGVALTFDIADAPNFAARLREAGVDPVSLRTMPVLRTLPPRADPDS